MWKGSFSVVPSSEPRPRSGNADIPAACSRALALDLGLLLERSIAMSGRILEVYVTAGRDEYVGKAEVVHADGNPAPPHRYGCRFREKVGPWVLQ